MYSNNRPADYKPPPGYQPTEVERKWIQDGELDKQGLEEVYMCVSSCVCVCVRVCGCVGVYACIMAVRNYRKEMFLCH